MTKRFLSVLLAVTMLASLLVPMAAFAEEYTVLTLDEEVTVTLTVGDVKWYQFTPEKSRTYSITSSDEVDVDPVAALYNSSMELIAENDDAEGSNFCITYDMVAGETYYLKAYEFDLNNEGSYTMVVAVSLPTDVFFDEYAITRFAGTEETLIAHVYPETADATLTWESSDNDVVAVDQNGKMSFLAAGEAAITATTLNGLTDTCWVKVIPVTGTWTLDEEKTIEMTGFETREETKRYFAFTPEETGYYCLYSYDIISQTPDNAIDPRAWVYDAEYSEREYNDDGGEDVNVSAQVALQAGETVYLMLELYDSQAVGSFKACLKKMITADSVSIDCGDIVMDQGGSMDIYVTFSPEGAWQEDYVVTSSDDTVVRVEDKTLIAVGGGEATVTVTTDLGLTDSIHVTVFAVDEIELDTTYTLEGRESDYGGAARYAFTPTVSGLYTITSSEAIGENAAVAVSVSDENDQLRYNDTDSASFSLTYELLANKTYYYDVLLECEAEISAVDFTVTKADETSISKAKLNVDIPVEITNPGDGAYFTFTPKFSGMYAVYAEPGEDVFDNKLYVYTSEWELFYSNDDGGGNGQYRLEEEFTAGETYYLKSILYSDNDTGYHTMRIEPLFEMSVMGDADGNGEVDTSDARLTLKAILGQENLTEEQAAVADMNDDGKLNSYDVRLILLACANTL